MAVEERLGDVADARRARRAARAAQAEGDRVHARPSHEPKERLDGVAVDGRHVEVLELGARGLGDARLAHVHGAHLPARDVRERARRRDELSVGSRVRHGDEKSHSALTCQACPLRRRSR